MMRSLLLALSARPAVGRAMDRHAATRRVVRRFVAGRDVAGAMAVLGRAAARGLGTAVTYLGESIRTERQARAAADTSCGGSPSGRPPRP